MVQNLKAFFNMFYNDNGEKIHTLTRTIDLGGVSRRYILLAPLVQLQCTKRRREGLSSHILLLFSRTTRCSLIIFYYCWFLLLSGARFSENLYLHAKAAHVIFGD